MAEYTRSEHFERQLGLVKWLIGLPESLGWYERVVVEAIKFKKRPYGWLLVVQGHRVGGKRGVEHLVAFVDGVSVADCLDALARQMRHQQIRWQPDRYPPDMGD